MNTRPPEPSPEQIAQWWAEARDVHADNPGLAIQIDSYLARRAAAWGWEARAAVKESLTAEVLPADHSPGARKMVPPPAAGPSDDDLALVYYDCCGCSDFMDEGGFEDAARAVLARWGRPASPPAEGEVAELVAWLRSSAVMPDRNLFPRQADRISRAADLLERQAAPAAEEVE